MTLKLITPPDAEPLSLADVKLHLRVDHSADDDLINSLIQAAREGAEHLTGRSLITQTWERVLNAFPACDIELGRPPVVEVVSLKYLDDAGVEQTMNAANYVVDADSVPGRVVPAEGYTWPITDDQPNAVRVRFTAGYGDAAEDVPAAIRSWMKLRVGTLYKLREEIVAGVSVADLPGGFAERLLDPYRIWSA